VFVRLHLALFPSGGPFLSSLNVHVYLRCLPPSGTLGPRPCRCSETWLTGRAGGPGLSRAAFISGRFGSLAMPCAEVTHPCVGQGRMLQSEPLAGAWPCFVACVCDCTWLCFWLVGHFPRFSLYVTLSAVPGFVSGWRALSSVFLCVKSIAVVCVRRRVRRSVRRRSNLSELRTQKALRRVAMAGTRCV
jgi:hypothetical protein